MSRRAERVLAGSSFFEQFPPEDLMRLGTWARFVRYEAGAQIFAEGEPATQFCVLVSGAVDLSFGTSPLHAISHPGYPVGWSSLVEPYTYRASATAREHTTMLVLPRDDLDRYARKNPRFGVALMRGVIGLIGDRVQATRLRLIARRYDDEVAAIRQLVHDSGDTLPLSSPLHKIAHYLANRPTIDDAFHTLEVVRRRGDPTESRVAELCLDVLGNVRRELDLYQRLQAIYSAVADAPPDMDPEAVRRRSLAGFRELFAGTRYRIAGRHLLPERPGQIFIMNHLMNHPDNLLPNDFILTLDTHFVASMILLERYGEAPIRVVRKSRPDEYGHQRFYDRLGYIYTYSGYVDPDPADPAIALEHRRRFFFESAAGHLGRGRNILICPEGTSGPTEESPLRFRPGAFELATHVTPEPLIVPIAVANFDRKLTRTTTAAVVHPPFRLSACVADPTDHQALLKFLNDEMTPQFRAWVQEAVQLAGDEPA
jgi:CRP-like cAMP-binding protein/1-acyl-sn-glycerol-3-phosphate acyltransferase